MALASCLVDTNILLRVASRSGAEHPVVDRALAQLAEQGTILYYTLQNMAEFWNVMTRPKARNGFEFSLAEAEREIRAIESGMTLLPDNAAVYSSGAKSSFSTVFRESRYTMRVWRRQCTSTE